MGKVLLQEGLLDTAALTYEMIIDTYMAACSPIGTAL
jgi:hypothetical protein